MCSSFEITASRNDEALSRKFSLLTRQALNIIEKNRRPRATSPPKNPRRLSNQLFRGWGTPLKKKDDSRSIFWGTKSIDLCRFQEVRLPWYLLGRKAECLDLTYVNAYSFLLWLVCSSFYASPPPDKLRLCSHYKTDSFCAVTKIITDRVLFTHKNGCGGAISVKFDFHWCVFSYAR